MSSRPPRPRLAFRLLGIFSGEAEGALAILCLAAVILACVIASPRVTNRVRDALGWPIAASSASPSMTPASR